jgi:hypothetical protein
MKGKMKFYKRTATPSFTKEVDRVRYWSKEKQRWIEGYDGMSGLYYHFLQEQVIKNRVTGKLLYPRALESDYITYQQIEESRRNFTPTLVIKARATRFSTFGGAATNYFMRAYPGSTCLVTSADQSRISKLYIDKIKLTHDNYHEDIRYDILQEAASKTSTYMMLGVKYRDENGKIVFGKSDIFCNQTSSSDLAATSFSGTGAIFGFYDEFALNPRRNLVLQSSESCYIDADTSKRVGLLVMGGTVEHTLSSEDLSNFVMLYNSCIEKGWNVIFLPYWYRFHDENGYIDKDAAERWYEEEYNNHAKTGDKSDLTAFLKNNPSSMEDVISLGGSGFFSERSVDRLKEQRDRINASGIKHESYRLEKRQLTLNVESFPDNNGKYIIQEHPLDGVTYNMVVDGVATGSEFGDGNSKVAAVMIKQFDPRTQLPFQTVASMEYRPQSLDQVFPLLLDFAKYYNRYNGFNVIHPEASNSTHELLPQYMLKEGYIQWMKHRVDYSKAGNIDVRKYGQPMNNHSIPYAIGRWNELIDKYCEGITMINIINSMLEPISKNADLRSAMLLYAFLLNKDYDKPAKPKQDEYKLQPKIIYKNGKTEFIFEKVKINKK